MLKLPVNEVALENALENGLGSVCLKCGSRRTVSSVTIWDPVQKRRYGEYGWVCKQCHDDMLPLQYEGKMMFGDEGLLNDNFTVYDEMEIAEKVEKFNQLFEDKGCRARLFPVYFDLEPYYCCVEIVVDDERPELAAAVKEAESIEKLCRNKILFSRKRH